MNRPYKKSLFIFRRDLRVHDNIGLAHALKESDTVTLCFIFDPRQISAQNTYRSQHAIAFMLAALASLQKEIEEHKGQLYFFYGNAEDVVAQLTKTGHFDAVFCNRDYTPFSIKRDEAIQKICLHYNCAFNQFDDALLYKPEEVLSGSGTPYVVFTAFYKKTLQLPVVEPKTTRLVVQHHAGKLAGAVTLSKIAQELLGNTAAVDTFTDPKKVLKNIKNFQNYQATKDYPSQPTTHLAPHLKFGTISVRNAYHAIRNELGADHPLLRQLVWRDFFTHVAYHSPFVFGQAFQEKYNKLWWDNDPEKFARWRTGTTGFPIVDAGMRELNATGFMHNRVRMITASFLVKDLHIDWRMGERYFAQQLADYDPAVNNGNWQWVASTGCDAQPYFRIFNPWLQQKKFDADCMYIKRWVPELQNFVPKIIHRWYSMHRNVKHAYYAPMVEHAKEAVRAKQRYKNAR